MPEAIFRNDQNPAETGIQCPWVVAGVVRKKNCLKQFHCADCRYDRVLTRQTRYNRLMARSGLRSAGNRGRLVHWRQAIMSLPPRRRPCLHHLRGRIAFRSCTHDYGCADCEFDQYFLDQHTVFAAVRPVALMHVSGFAIPQGYYLHPCHTWMTIEEGGMVRVGVDDFAWRLLGPPDRVAAPLMGKAFNRGDAGIRIERGGREAHLLMPIAGVVTETNPRVADNGALAAVDPYGEGWILRMHPSAIRQDLKRLFIGTAAAALFTEDIDHLYEDIEAIMPLAADGGFLGKDIYGSLPELGWNNLVRRYLQ
ncbi:MAG: glycine cleavage system protein H [Pseudomonadota bacterium]